MSGRDDLAAIEPAALGAVAIGDGPTAATITVRPLKVRQIPAVARAVRPLADQIGELMAGGVTPGAVLDLLEHRIGEVLAVLHAATDAPVAALEDSTVDQVGELLLAVISANRDFLRGRLIAALQTAAAATGGAGPTQSKP